MLALYAEKGWRPVIAPEVEFYLVSQNVDPDFPLTPPTGQSGRSESASQPYGLEAMNEYEDIHSVGLFIKQYEKTSSFFLFMYSFIILLASPSLVAISV